MVNHPLSVLPERLEAITSSLSQLLFQRYREQVGPALTQAGVVRPAVAGLFHDRSPPEQQLDQFIALALYADCLSVVTLACLLGSPPLDWGRIEGLRVLLTRIASFYAATHPTYREFRTLPRERLPDFFNRFATSPAPFGLLNEATRFQGLRLCAHVSGGGPPNLLQSYLDHVMLPLWQYGHTRLGIADGLAAQVRQDLTHLVGAC